MNRSRRNSDRGPGSRRPSRHALAGCPDEQLVEFVLDGNDEAFEVLFERHVTDSLWYAREVLGSWSEAEEAVSHSFAAAHAYLETRGRETEFAPWLQTILGNHCLSMLHARAPGPKRRAEKSNVVDLGEWRLRRKLFGVTLPIAPGAALRDSVMAACGIGAGAATTAGAPLMGGALANLAAVAVVAGGFGVASNVVSERAAAVDANRGVPVAHVADKASGPRRHSASPRKGAKRVSGAPALAVREVELPIRDVGELRTLPDHVVIEPESGKSSPATPVRAPPGPTAPEFDPATAAAPVAIPPPVDATLRQVVEVIETELPATGDVTEVRLPEAVDPQPIGDDLVVTPVESPDDVRALLTRGADAPPN